MADRFDKFTERALTVLKLAQEESHRFNHNYIGTEHLLLGIVREGEGVAAKVLANLGVELKNVRSAIELIIGRGDRAVVGESGLTPKAKHVIELAVDESRRLGHHYIGTEHILLGLVREGEGIAAGVLESLGVSLDKVRSEVARILEPATIPTPKAPLIDVTNVVQLRIAAICRRWGDQEVRSVHVLAGMLDYSNDRAGVLLKACGIDTVRMRAVLELIRPEPYYDSLGQAQVHRSKEVDRLRELAKQEAGLLGHNHLGDEHYLLAMLRARKGIAYAVLSTFGLTLRRARRETRKLFPVE